MTDYTLDIAKWRSGSTGEHMLGTGSTALINYDGFSCCLGQFSLQQGHLDPVKHTACIGRSPKISDPEDLATEINKPYDPAMVWIREEADDCPSYYNTLLATQLMEANDDSFRTPQQRVDEIRRLLEGAGHTLKVVNGHLLEKRT